MKHAAVILISTLVAGSGIAAADTQYLIPGEGEIVQEDVAPVMLPQKPHDIVKFVGQHVLQGDAKLHENSVNSHVIYMNQCAAGCTVTPSQTDDSTTDHSSIPQSLSHLSAFIGGASSGPRSMSCMQSTMSRFNLTVTDVDPGAQPHFEVMVAGSASQLLGGGSQGVGGIARCRARRSAVRRLPAQRARVRVRERELLRGPTARPLRDRRAGDRARVDLDHVVDKTDPMTYNQYAGMRNYKDGMSCGSDCQGGQSPFGLSCTGSNDSTATHACMSNGQVTQTTSR